MRVLWRCRANSKTGAKVHDPQVSKELMDEINEAVLAEGNG
ncbi:MAG: hypothetical protein ACJAX6_000572 [Limisphaerales bacterium]|jgi:hypothetical protein